MFRLSESVQTVKPLGHESKPPLHLTTRVIGGFSELRNDPPASGSAEASRRLGTLKSQQWCADTAQSPKGFRFYIVRIQLSRVAWQSLLLMIDNHRYLP